MPHRLDDNVKAPPELIRWVVRSSPTDNRPEWHQMAANSMSRYRFTPRERDIGWGVLEGLGRKEIASQLRVTESTVRNIMTSMYKKAGVQDRTQLALRLLEVY